MSGGEHTRPGVWGMNRRTVLQTTALASTAAVGTQSAGASGVTDTPNRATSSFSKEHHTIESWDGTTLETTLYLPKESGPHPVVLMTHGWGAFRQSPMTVPKAVNYAKNGYAVLTYDSRGFGGSSGTVTLNGPNEVKDAQHLITWLANRPEIATVAADDPMIGMDGISYAGGIQFQAASADERLDALVPRITWNDMEYSLVPNGVVKIGWLSALLGLGEFNTLLDGDAELTEDLSDWYWHSFKENEPPAEAVAAFREVSFAHEDEVSAPTFLLQGWNDSLFNPSEALDSYRKLQDAGVETAIGFYEGGHDLTEVTVDFEDRGKMNSDALAWMNKHVLGEDSSIPGVQNYLPQRDEWRVDEQWPPADVAHEQYELGDASRDGENELAKGWFFADEEVTYEWTVDDDIEVIGEPEIDLEIEVHGPEARIFFELFHNGSNINGMDEAYRLDGPGTHTISVTYPGIQQFLSSGDAIGLNVSVTNTWYLDSRDSDGITIKPNGSRLWLPQRHDENAPDDGDDDDDGGCFITTATARDETTLNSLRRFRDESMSTTPVGTGLVGLYYRISPPIADTLDRHSESRTANATRSIVERCASLSDKQEATESAPKRIFLGILLTIMYMVGILVAAGGHAGITLKELFIGE